MRVIQVTTPALISLMFASWCLAVPPASHRIAQFGPAARRSNRRWHLGVQRDAEEQTQGRRRSA